MCLAVITITSGAYVHTGSTLMSTASIIWVNLFGIVFALGYTSMQVRRLRPTHEISLAFIQCFFTYDLNSPYILQKS